MGTETGTPGAFPAGETEAESGSESQARTGEGTCLEETKLVIPNLSKTAFRSCAPSAPLCLALLTSSWAINSRRRLGRFSTRPFLLWLSGTPLLCSKVPGSPVSSGGTD